MISKKPVVYMAGRMGIPVDNKVPGGKNSCWRIFDVSQTNGKGFFDLMSSRIIALAPEPDSRFFEGTNVSFLYSGPWKAMGSYHGYIHGVTSSTSHDMADASFNGALKCILRSDVFVAYIDDLEAHGTLVELGFAKANNKRIIIVTSSSTRDGLQELEEVLWFAIKTADKHISIDLDRESNNLAGWKKAHKEIANIIGRWYPSSII